jgi:microcystin-dependent protein
MTIFYNRTKSVKGFPVGSIIPWSGAIGDIPRGWIPCTNSVSLRVSDYPLLYQVIGNTYGGTQNISFRLPQLNDGTAAAVDIFKGHFYYLQDKGAAHRPEKININDDEFWKNVGGSNSGNSPSSAQTNWTSTIDIVGTLRNIENLSATYSPIVVVPGEYSEVLVPAGRKLSDVHLPSHAHDAEPSPENSNTEDIQMTYTTGTSRPSRFGTGTDCFGGFLGIGRCRISHTRAPLYRPVCRDLSGTEMARNDDPNCGGARVPTVRSDVTGQVYGADTFRWGGGDFASVPGDTGGETSSICYIPSNANGYSSGDMYSHISGQKYFFSSLDPDIFNAVTLNDYNYEAVRSNPPQPTLPDRGDKFRTVKGHQHGTLEYSFSSKYIRVLNPGLVQDVRLNTVQINNQTGINFGTIVADTTSPSLTMQYIIKAY